MVKSATEKNKKQSKVDRSEKLSPRSWLRPETRSKCRSHACGLEVEHSRKKKSECKGPEVENMPDAFKEQ